MKKALYTTTALAAAGMFAFSGTDAVAAEKVKLGLGGYFIWAAGASDSEAKSHDTHSGVNMITDSEIYFRGNTTLDNGIRFDVIVQLETDDVNDGGSIDESYLKVGNMKQWGEFRLGTTKSAHFLFRAMGPHVSTIVNATNADPSALFVPSTTPLKGPATFFNHEGGADRMLAAYITPNLNGFQGGISYTPSESNVNTPPQTKGMMATEAKNVSLGGNYKGKFGDASIAISGGYTAVDGGKTNSAGVRIGEVDYTTTQAGLKVSFAGFSIGGHWAERKDDVADSTADDREGFMAGVGYKTGPWNLALTWLNTTDDVNENVDGEVEHNQYLLGMTYSLGAGVVVGASVFSIDLQDETKTMTMADDPNTDDNEEKYMGGNHNEGWGALAGVRVNF